MAKLHFLEWLRPPLPHEPTRLLNARRLSRRGCDDKKPRIFSGLNHQPCQGIEYTIDCVYGVKYRISLNSCECGVPHATSFYSCIELCSQSTHLWVVSGSRRPLTAPATEEALTVQRLRSAQSALLCAEPYSQLASSSLTKTVAAWEYGYASVCDRSPTK